MSLYTSGVSIEYVAVRVGKEEARLVAIAAPHEAVVEGVHEGL